MISRPFVPVLLVSLLMVPVCCFAQTGLFEQVSGSLSQISVGADGAAWGLDPNQTIFTWNSATSQFEQVPGQLVQIAVGNANAVWGLNAQGLIFRWNSTKQTWTYIPGLLNQIAVGADGDVWGLSANASGQCGTNPTNDLQEGCTFVWHYNQQAQTWDYVDTTQLSDFLGVTQVAVGNDGAVYALIDISPGYLDPLWYNPGTGQFQYVTGYANPVNAHGVVDSLAVGYDGDLWATNNFGESLAHYSPLQPEWQAITQNDAIAKLAVGSGNNVFGIAYSLTPDGAVYQWNAQTASWVPLGISLNQIAAGADGSAWGVDSDHRVFRFNAPTQTYPALHQLPGSFAQISIGADGTGWGVDANDLIYSFDRQTQTWQNVPGALAQVSVGSAGDVWGVNAGDGIWLWGDQVSANPPGWENIPGGLAQIAVAANGVFGINTYGQTYLYSSYQWVNIPGTLVQLSAGEDGTVWGINAYQQIYRYDGKANEWVNVPGALVQISVGNADNIWGVNADRRVYRYDATIAGWVQIPGALLTQIAVAFDGAVWGVNDGGGLYQWDAAIQNFNLIGTGVTNVAVGNDASVFAWNKNTGATYWYF